jgi:CBS domain-containing protein
MNVGEMCSRGVVCVPESASLREVAVLMNERHIGSVVVLARSTAPSATVGIITDRDIVRAQLAHVADLSRLRVADVMAAAPLLLRADESLEDAVEVMRARGVRRAPVITAQGALVGIVSTDDLISELARQLGTLARLLQRQPEHGRRYT